SHSYDDVKAVAMQHRMFSSSSGISFPELDFSTPLIPAEVDPPAHGAYRPLLMKFLTRERVDSAATLRSRAARAASLSHGRWRSGRL
ncbi:MAG: hypothetical protein ABW034_24050, partial [Steroidobacteraceae bacterium]